MQGKCITAVLITSVLFTCINDTNPSSENKLMVISDQTILGNWIGANTKPKTCVDSSGNTAKGTVIFECQYTIYQDSITTSRNKILSTNCDLFSLDYDDLPTHTDPSFIKSFWELLNDSLYIYSEKLEHGVYDTSLIRIIKLIPYSSNKIIFKTDAYSDICRKYELSE